MILPPNQIDSSREYVFKVHLHKAMTTKQAIYKHFSSHIKTATLEYDWFLLIYDIYQ